MNFTSNTGKKAIALFAVAFMVLASMLVVFTTDTQGETSNIEDDGISITENTETGTVYPGVSVVNSGSKLTITMDNADIKNRGNDGESSIKTALDIDAASSGGSNPVSVEIILKGENKIKLVQDDQSTEGMMAYGLRCNMSNASLTITGEEGASLTIDSSEVTAKYNAGLGVGCAGAYADLTIAADINIIAGVKDKQGDFNRYAGIELVPIDGNSTLTIKDGSNVNITVYGTVTESSNMGYTYCLYLPNASEHGSEHSIVDSTVEMAIISNESVGDLGGCGITARSESCSGFKIDNSNVKFSSVCSKFADFDFDVSKITNVNSIMAGDDEETAEEVSGTVIDGTSHYVSISTGPSGPTVEITSQTSGSVSSTSFEITGTTVNAVSVEITVNGKAVSVDVSDNQFSKTVKLKNGENTISIVAVGEDGSRSEAQSFSITCTGGSSGDNTYILVIIVVAAILVLVAMIAVLMYKR